MLPIVQRSLPLAHQFDFATPPDAGYRKFGARDSQACLDVCFWAQSGHSSLAPQCPLSEAKRTSGGHREMCALIHFGSIYCDANDKKD